MAEAPIEWLPLAEVASRPGLGERIVAWRDGAALERAHFLEAVSRWQAAFDPVQPHDLFVHQH